MRAGAASELKRSNTAESYIPRRGAKPVAYRAYVSVRRLPRPFVDHLLKILSAELRPKAPVETLLLGSNIGLGDATMLKYSFAIGALLLASPMAFAQGAGDTGKQGGAGMSSSAPSSSGPESSGSSHERSGDRSGASSGASEGASGSNSSASDVAPGHRKEGGSANSVAPGHTKSGDSASDVAPGHNKKLDKSDRRSESKSKATDRDNRDRADTSRDRNSRESNRNDARSRDREGASSGASEGTEGRSGRDRGSITSVTSEQKTKVRSVFSRHHVEPARNLNVAVSVGARIPHSVHLYPVPVEIIDIVPAYRDYEYIMLEDNRIAIVDPDTFEIVDIIVLA